MEQQTGEGICCGVGEVMVQAEGGPEGGEDAGKEGRGLNSIHAGVRAKLS